MYNQNARTRAVNTMRFTLTIYRNGNAYTYRSDLLSTLMAMAAGQEYVLTDRENP